MALTKIPSELSSTTGIVDNSNATAITIDSSENVGIGTSSPSTGLHVKGAGSASWLTLENTTSSNYSIVDFKNENGDRVGYVGTYNGDDAFYVYGARNGPMQFFTNASERMRIDASGRVTMPSQPHIHGSPSNASGSGIANAFYTSASRNTLSFSNSRVTVPVAGAYLINFNTISDTGTGRVDADVKVNGLNVASSLTEANGQGYHQKNTSVVLNLSANDYIQVDNDDWYNAGATYYDNWRTLSVTLLG